MKFKKTVFVSFPRSGHHMIAQALQRVFDRKLKYREPYKDGHAGEWDLIKSHDFTLGQPMLRSMQYLVLVRNPLNSIISRMAQIRKEGRALPPGEPSMREFRQQFEYWRKFVWKWVINGPTHRLVITYEGVLADPRRNLEGIARYLTDEPISEQGLDTAAEYILSNKPTHAPHSTPYPGIA